MPTNIRTAAVARWVGRGNGPSRVTGATLAQQLETATRTITHITLGAARINTAHRTSHMAQRTARRRISRIRSEFTARRAVKGATQCGSLQFPMRSGARMVRQAPARDRMSPLWQLMAHRHFGHWTAGRSQRARRSPIDDDSQRGPTGSRTMHRLLLGRITNCRGGSAERRKRCYFDIGLSRAIFLLTGLPPKKNIDSLQTISSRVTDVGREERMDYARAQRSRRRTANGRTTLEIGQHRWSGCWQWVPVAMASSACSSVCWHGQLHRFLSLLIKRGVDRGFHSRTRLDFSTYEGASNQCWATASLQKATPRMQRIRHWSRGTVQTTFRHAFALHASLPVNRGYKPGNPRDGRRRRSASTYDGASNQCGATSCHKSQSRMQRIRHWSRGTVRTTFRHICALHASLPVNRGYKPGNRRVGRRQRSASTSDDASNQCGATLSLHKAQTHRQRIRHWSRGSVQATFRHSGALHVSLPVNRGYETGNSSFIRAIGLPHFHRRQVILFRAHITAPAPSECHVRVSAAVRQGWGTTGHRWSAAELLDRGSAFYGVTSARTLNGTVFHAARFPAARLHQLESVGYHAGKT